MKASQQVEKDSLCKKRLPFCRVIICKVCVCLCLSPDGLHTVLLALACSRSFVFAFGGIEFVTYGQAELTPCFLIQSHQAVAAEQRDACL